MLQVAGPETRSFREFHELYFSADQPQNLNLVAGGDLRPLRRKSGCGLLLAAELGQAAGTCSLSGNAHGCTGDKLITERYEDGKRFISVDTAKEFGQVLDQLDNYRVEIEAPEEVIEAFGILDSAEELGIEPDDGLPPEAYERGRWN